MKKEKIIKIYSLKELLDNSKFEKILNSLLAVNATEEEINYCLQKLI